MVKETKKTNKLLISFDSVESQAKVNRALDGLALARHTTKGAIAQCAIEKEVLPHTSQVAMWFEEYCSGKKSLLSIMASFFRTAGDDIGRGRSRCNCEPVVSGVYDYLHHYCNRTAIDVSTAKGDLWPSEAITLYRLDWKKLERSQSIYYKIADMLERLDGAPVMSNFCGPSEESFAFGFFLIVDSVVEEWQDMCSEEGRYLQVPINHGNDVLLLPRSEDCFVLNLMDASDAKNATTICIENKEHFSIPNYVLLSELPTNEIPEETWEGVDAAIAAICPDYALALEQHVPPVIKNGICQNPEEYLSSPRRCRYGVHDAEELSSEILASPIARIIRGER